MPQEFYRRGQIEVRGGGKRGEGEGGEKFREEKERRGIRIKIRLDNEIFF